MKKSFQQILCITLAIAVILVACKRPKEKLIGHWRCEVYKPEYRQYSNGENGFVTDTLSMEIIVTDDSITWLEYPKQIIFSSKYLASDDSIRLIIDNDTAMPFSYSFIGDSLNSIPTIENQFSNAKFGRVEFDDEVVHDLKKFGFSIEALKGTWICPEYRFHFNPVRCDSMGYELLHSLEIRRDSTLLINSSSYSYTPIWKGISSEAFDYHIVEFYDDEISFHLIPHDTTCESMWIKLRRAYAYELNSP